MTNNSFKMENNVRTFIVCVSLVIVCVHGLGRLNDECRGFGDCERFGGYYCGKNRTCQCLSPEYIPNKGRDKCVGVVGQKCKYDEHCIYGAYCELNVKCQCKEEFHRTVDNYCSNATAASAATRYVLLPAVVMIFLKLCLWLG